MDPRIHEIAARQHDVVTRQQLFEAGFTRHDIDGLVRCGALRRIHRCVYVVGGAELTPWTRATAAILAATAGRSTPRPAGAAASDHAPPHEPAHGLALLLAPAPHAPHAPALPAAGHHLAAALWNMLPIEAVTAIHLVGERPSILPGIVVHRAALDDDELVRLRGVPVTSRARTILDLAATGSAREVEQALAGALRQDPRILERVGTLLTRRPKHRGSGDLRRLLAAFHASGTAPLFLRSLAEEISLTVIRGARLPEPSANVWIAGYEVDFVWLRHRVVMEVDGLEFHGSPTSFHRDRERDAALVRAGFVVLRFTWRQLNDDAPATIAAIASTLARQEILHGLGDRLPA